MADGSTCSRHAFPPTICLLQPSLTADDSNKYTAAGQGTVGVGGGLLTQPSFSLLSLPSLASPTCLPSSTKALVGLNSNARCALRLRLYL